MSTVYPHWASRIHDAADASARRNLLRAAMSDRVGALGDGPATRQTTWAIATLQFLLGNRDAAVSEARQLVKLTNASDATDGEAREARGLLEGMGEKAPPREVRQPPARSDVQPRADRPQREARPRQEAPERSDAADGVRRAREAALAGQHEEALRLLKGRRSPGETALRWWVQLEAARSGPVEERDRRLAELDSDLRRTLDLPLPGTAAAATEPKRARKAEPSAAPAEPRPPRAERPKTAPAELDVALVAAVASGDTAAIQAAFAPYQRAWRALSAVEDQIETLPVAGVANLLDIALAATPGRFPEATTVAVRLACRDAACAEALASGRWAERLGGPGVDMLVAVVRAATANGVRVGRILKGATKREREAQPALEALEPRLDGLWRALVSKGESKGELWSLHAASAEVRAAAPLLLSEARLRVVAIAIDPDLASWWASLGGPEAIGWSGDEGDAVGSAFGAWT